MNAVGPFAARSLSSVFKKLSDRGQ